MRAFPRAARIACSSVCGGGHYYEQFDTTLNALEKAMAVHSDLPLVLEEANLFLSDALPRTRAAAFKGLAFKLGSGTTRSRHKENDTEDKRLLYFVSTNDPLDSLIVEDTEGARAAADRLITIELGSESPLGVLNHVPEDHADAGAFLDSVIEGTARHYGVAMPHFLQCLVNARAQNEAALRSRISELLATFKEKGADGKARDGSERRVVDAFGLVYAAGTLAKEFGALPKNIECGPAARACYQLYRNRQPSRLPFADCVKQVAEGAHVIAQRGRRRETLTDEQLEAGIFKIDGRDGVELLIAPERIFHYFPDWKSLRNRAEVKADMHIEEGRLRVKRSVDGNTRRMFSFRVQR